MNIAITGVIVHILVEIALIVRVMTRPHREPASRIAWVAVMAALPIIGILAYILFGETNIGRRRIARMKKVIEGLPPMSAIRPDQKEHAEVQVPERYEHLFRTGRSISGFAVMGGNSAGLMADSNATIDSMVADIDAATDHVHLLFYIWLPDNNGRRWSRRWSAPPVVELHVLGHGG